MSENNTAVEEAPPPRKAKKTSVKSKAKPKKLQDIPAPTSRAQEILDQVIISEESEAEEVPQIPEATDFQSSFQPDDFDAMAQLHANQIGEQDILEMKATWFNETGYDVPVEAVALYGDVFVYRSMFRDEYTAMMQKAAAEGLTKTANEDIMVETCILWSSIDDIRSGVRPAGLNTALSEYIAILSKFGSPAIPVRL